MMGGATEEEEGLVPRICHQLFASMEEAKRTYTKKNVNARTSFGAYYSGEEEDSNSSSSDEDSEFGPSRRRRPLQKDVDEEESDAQDTVEFGLKATYVEIYNEKIYDLLSNSPDPQNLRLREDPEKKRVFVEGKCRCGVLYLYMLVLSM